MKRIIAYQIGHNIIIKNYYAGRRDRFDVYRLSPAKENARRIGCELPLGLATKVALGEVE